MYRIYISFNALKSNKTLKDSNTQSLARFLMDRCQSLHLALKMYFWYQAAVEDGIFARQKCHDLWNECEMAAVNSKSRSYLRLNSYPTNHPLGGQSQSQSYANISTKVTRSDSNDSVEEETKSRPVHRSHSLPDMERELSIPESPPTEHSPANNNSHELHSSHSDDDVVRERKSSIPTPLSVQDITGTFQDPLTDSSYKPEPQPSLNLFWKKSSLTRGSDIIFFTKSLNLFKP